MKCSTRTSIISTNGYPRLVFDFGTRKIGIASANRLSGTTTPLATVAARDGVPEWREIEALIQEWSPTCWSGVVPSNTDEHDSEMTQRARIRRLAQ